MDKNSTMIDEKRTIMYEKSTIMVEITHEKSTILDEKSTITLTLAPYLFGKLWSTCIMAKPLCILLV